MVVSCKFTPDLRRNVSICIAKHVKTFEKCNVIQSKFSVRSSLVDILRNMLSSFISSCNMTWKCSDNTLRCYYHGSTHNYGKIIKFIEKEHSFHITNVALNTFCKCL